MAGDKHFGDSGQEEEVSVPTKRDRSQRYFFDVRITLRYYEFVATDRNLERGVAMPGTSLGEFLLASEQDLKGQADI
ncbi:hypothetical protein NLK61_09550 [Pseudomonas fuscovaginae UPB0736]|uniref:hypothetical protein n=1 Tax=Pseudomonas asplenii TaxID=53407 RepID=UPI00211F2C6F|nr:hypothetical protein [Pseudomonas fuscovaginae]UUQ66862.1 hypothetical protein NLK61_09550 [Pseudomonas fuscovaginae UPB0736]